VLPKSAEANSECNVTRGNPTLDRPPPDELCRVASMDLSGGNGSSYHATDGCDCVFIELDSWANNGLGADPRAVCESNRLHDEAEGRI
jgi:hypothetical protein